eukprot:213522-Chlamydomonas_euryale.AAC.2
MYHMLRVGSGWDEELRARCGGRGAAEMTQYAVLGMHIGGQRMDASWMSAFSNLQVRLHACMRKGGLECMHAESRARVHACGKEG